MLRKILPFFFVPALACLCCAFELTRQDSSDLLEAADEIISSSFKSSAVTINFVTSLSDETKRERSVLINSLVGRCDVVYVEDAEAISQRHRLYNVILIEDFQSFLRLSRQMSSNTFVIDGFFLFILVNGSIPEMAEVTKNLWALFIYRVNFLVETETGLSLLTFSPFSKAKCVDDSCEKRCGDSTPVVVIRDYKSKNFSGDFYPEQLTDLHECPIKVVTFNCPPTMMIKYRSEREYEMRGIDGEMLKLLAEVFNFKIDLFHISDLIRWGALYENGTATGAMSMIINGEADFTLGMYTITYLRSKFMTSSEFYYSVPFILVVPPGAALTPFEKLFRPFSLVVWVLLLLTFAIAGVVVTIFKLQPEPIKDFVLGIRNTSPYLNILNVFVGGSMPHLPGRNFARYLLMMFLIFSIVKRTLYQGALFQFLQADDRQREIQTIDELVQKNLKVYMMPSSVEHTQNMKFRHNRVVVNSTVFGQKRLATRDPASKFAVTSSLEQVLYFNKMNYKNSSTMSVCAEYLFTFQYGIYYRKNSYLKEVFDQKISIFKSSGLMDFWARDDIGIEFLNIKLQDDSPKKLNIEQLRGGFEVLFIGCALGCLIFFLEILASRCRLRTLQKLIEFLT